MVLPELNKPWISFIIMFRGQAEEKNSNFYSHQ